MKEYATGAERQTVLRAQFEALLERLARDDTPSFAAQRLAHVLAAEEEDYVTKAAWRLQRRPLDQKSKKALPSPGLKMRRSSEVFVENKKRGRRRIDNPHLPREATAQHHLRHYRGQHQEHRVALPHSSQIGPPQPCFPLSSPPHHQTECVQRQYYQDQGRDQGRDLPLKELTFDPCLQSPLRQNRVRLYKTLTTTSHRLCILVLQYSHALRF